MLRDDSSLCGRSLERRRIQERYVDARSGDEFTLEHLIETSESPDGPVETQEQVGVRVIDCNHLHRLGENIARCEGCSEKAGRPVYVCEKCAVTCPVTGQSLCLRCTKLGPDGRRYSPKGYKQAKKMGLFDRPPAPVPQPPSPVCMASRPKRNLVTRVLEWW